MVNKRVVLKWFLVLSGLVQILYFGCSHLFFPQWYLRSIGMDLPPETLDTTLLFIHEIGVLAVGLGVASLLAARDPVKNVAIIVALYVVTIGSIATSTYHILFKGVAQGEWLTVALLAVQVVVLTGCYPWQALRRQA